MYFNSYEFLLLFFPITVCGYYLINRFGRRPMGECWLLLASIAFYLFFSLPAGIVLLGSILVNYLLYRLLRRSQRLDAEHNGGKKATAILAVGITLNILLLFVFKYAATGISFCNRLFGSDFNVIHILLPVGISFFTFSQISFLVDCKRDDFTSYSLLEYALFVSFFPKILSGPIATAKEMIPQFRTCHERRFDQARFAKGLYAFAFGLAKKVLIADYLAILTGACFGNPGDCSGIEALFAILGYSLQLYFDFSGYCDMADGVCMMLNIDLPQNFNSPYKALDIIDFWKRWHMTLTAFLTKYLYFPLGGNRKGKARQYLNILLVFLISGIWHGAGLTFIVWGLLHGIVNVLTRIAKPVLDKIPKILRRVTTFLIVTATWVVFRADSLTDAGTMFSRLFSRPFRFFGEDLTEALLQPAFASVLHRVLPIDLVFLIFIGFCLFAVFFMKNTRQRMQTFRPTFGRLLVSVLLLALSIVSLTGFSSFIYGGF